MNMPTIQTLISTMHQTDHSLLDKMNIQTDAIVVNQCDRDEIERFEYKGHKILWMSLKERGVGLSRNTALMRATADIVLFADDDVVYVDDYPKLVVQAFEKLSQADFIVFAMQVHRSTHTPHKSKKQPILHIHRLHWYNSLRFGTYGFGVRSRALKAHNINFHLMFGGGTPFSSGEDSIFIMETLKKKLKIYATTTQLGTVHHQTSTWFHGYTEKYWFDKGVLFQYLFGIWAYPLGVALILKNRQQITQMGFLVACKYLWKGVYQAKKVLSARHGEENA